MVSSNILIQVIFFFSNSPVDIFPNLEQGNALITFFNEEVMVGGNGPFIPDEGLISVQLDSLPVGMHSLSMTLNCVKEVFTGSSNDTCDCINDETHATKEIEIIEPTYIRIDSLIFNQNINCDGANGLFCPDVYFDFAYYDIPHYVTSNYYYTEDAPIQLAFGDTIAIYPSECTVPITIYDFDQFNANDIVGSAVMNPTNMAGWTTGSHEIEDNFWIVITRLN